MFVFFLFANFFCFFFSSLLSQYTPGSDLIILDQVLIETNTVLDSGDKSNFTIKFKNMGGFLVKKNSILQITNAIFMFENGLQPTQIFTGESNSTFIFKYISFSLDKNCQPFPFFVVHGSYVSIISSSLDFFSNESFLIAENSEIIITDSTMKFLQKPSKFNLASAIQTNITIENLYLTNAYIKSLVHCEFCPFVHLFSITVLNSIFEDVMAEIKQGIIFKTQNISVQNSSALNLFYFEEVDNVEITNIFVSNHNLNNLLKNTGPIFSVKNIHFFLLTNSSFHKFTSFNLPAFMFLDETKFQQNTVSNSSIDEIDSSITYSLLLSSVSIQSVFASENQNGALIFSITFYGFFKSENLQILKCLGSNGYLLDINGQGKVLLLSSILKGNEGGGGGILVKAEEFRMIRSVLESNVGMGLHLIQYYVNFIWEEDNRIIDNFAVVSLIGIGPFDFFTFQYFTALRPVFISNSVLLFGGCYEFQPTSNGNYSVLAGIFDNSKSGYMAGSFDLFCTNPTYLPTFYIFENNTFTHNFAPFEAGAISYFFHDTSYKSIVKNCVFQGNFGGVGGAILFSMDNRENSVHFENCTFFLNSAFGGGAFSIVSGSIYINNCFFLSNSALRGGSIESINYNKLNIENSTFSNSTALSYGGTILLIDNSESNFRNLIFNYSSSPSGALFYLDSFSLINISSSSIFQLTGQTGVILFLSHSGRRVGLVNDEGTQENKDGNLINAITNCKINGVEGGKSLFFVSFSLVEIKEVELQRVKGRMFFLVSSNVWVKILKIAEIYCGGNDEGCIFGARNSILNITEISVKNVTSINKGTVIFSKSSQIYLTTGSFFSIIGPASSGVLLHLLSSSASLSSLACQDLSPTLILSSSSQLSLSLITFSSKILLPSTFPLLMISSCSSFFLNSSRFNDLSFENGDQPLINILAPLGLHLISNTKFLKNMMQGGRIIKVEGGELINTSNETSEIVVKIQTCIFQENEGERGVAIEFLEEKEGRIAVQLENNIFTDNKAQKEGGALRYKFKQPEMKGNIFEKNEAGIYGNDIASFPTKINVTVNQSGKVMPRKIENSTNIDSEQPKYLYMNGKSGQKMENITVNLIDSLGQKYLSSDPPQIKLDIVTSPPLITYLSSHFFINISRSNPLYTSNFTNLEGATLKSLDAEGNLLFDDFVIVATPTSVVFLEIFSSSIPTFSDSTMNISLNWIEKNNISGENKGFRFYLPVVMVECELGEIYDVSINSCVRCSAGTYSFEVFVKECSSCPPNFICLGGSIINIENSFWRPTPSSLTSYSCDRNYDFCKGGYSSICKTGRTGKLCQSCEKKQILNKEGIFEEENIKIAPDFFGECRECFNDGVGFVILLATFILSGVVVEWMGRWIKEGKGQIDGAIMKILVSHYQMLVFVPAVNVEENRTPNNILGRFIGSWYIFDCLFDSLPVSAAPINRRFFIISLLFIFLILTWFAIKWLKNVEYQKFKQFLSLKTQNFGRKNYRLGTNTFMVNSLGKSSKFQITPSKIMPSEVEGDHLNGDRSRDRHEDFPSPNDNSLISNTLSRYELKSGENSPIQKINNKKVLIADIERNPDNNPKNHHENGLTARMLNFYLIFLFLVQPTFVEMAFQSMTCTEIEGQFFLKSALNYECWDNTHARIFIVLVLPHLLFWTVGLPIIFFRVYKTKIKTTKHFQTFTSCGFKRKFKFFGEILNFLRKLSAIMINTIFDSNDRLAPLMSLSVLGSLVLVHFYVKPYNYKILNNMDGTSLIVIFFNFFVLALNFDKSFENRYFYGTAYLLSVINFFFFFFGIIILFRKQVLKIWKSRNGQI